MPHPSIDNDGPLLVEPVFLDDEDGNPAMTVVVKATFDIGEGGKLALAADQQPIDLAGVFWGDPDESSYRFEPEGSPMKPATDIAVVGHACAPNNRTTVMDVGVRVGPVTKGVRVFGERKWFDAGVGRQLSAPIAFEKIAMQYERAFGGWDRTAADPADHACERRNTVGRGFHAGIATPLRADDMAPNIEDPGDLITTYTDRPAPAGLGFTLPAWLPRASFGGTYDAKWVESRMPRLPRDFDPKFYSGASPGLICPGFLRGDEPAQVVGMRHEGGLGFTLPGIPPPEIRIGLNRLEDARLMMKLDTVIIDTDNLQLLLLWRDRCPIAEGPPDVRSIEIRSPEAAAFPRSEVANA